MTYATNESGVTLVHPWDLETPEARCRRIHAQADELEWALRRQTAEFGPIAFEDTDLAGIPPAGDEDSTLRWR